MLVRFATTDVPPDRIATGLLHVCSGHILYALLLPRCCSSIAVDACFWVTSLRYLRLGATPEDRHALFLERWIQSVGSRVRRLTYVVHADPGRGRADLGGAKRAGQT